MTSDLVAKCVLNILNREDANPIASIFFLEKKKGLQGQNWKSKV